MKLLGSHTGCRSKPRSLVNYTNKAYIFSSICSTTVLFLNWFWINKGMMEVLFIWFSQNPTWYRFCPAEVCTKHRNHIHHDEVYFKWGMCVWSMCREGKLRLFKNGGWTANKRTIGGKKKHHSPKKKKKPKTACVENWRWERVYIKKLQKKLKMCKFSVRVLIKFCQHCIKGPISHKVAFLRSLPVGLDQRNTPIWAGPV